MFPSTSATAPRFLRPFTGTAPRRGMAASAAAPPPPPSPAPKAVRVVVKGRVQGVFFRDWTVETARSLGLAGWVRNRRDGTVEALLSGDPDKVDEMVSRRIPVGPPAAAVTAVVPSPADPVDPAEGFHRKPTA
ncbi:acylphosphatase [Panicum miliaceum]|uniref:Acylphosphatase n=1 Tax=Panicum miliaceum TaxID=4540 RepID=A0A3L6RZP1_PANMI|nr:acylphosphatase [Panicum miliaceum]